MQAYPHMCRDGHEEIGHRNSEREMCAVCLLLATLEDLTNAAIGAVVALDDGGNANGAAYLRACIDEARSNASEVQR